MKVPNFLSTGSLFLRRILPCLAPGILALALSSCGNAYRTYSAYNMLGRTQLLTGDADTFIVGVEKRSRKEIGVHEADVAAIIHDVHSKDRPGVSANDIRMQNRKKEIYFNDPKEMFVSHIVETRRGQITRFLYNNYKDRPNPAHENGFQKGLAALGELETEVKEAFTREKYSHVFVMAMGWANDQEESITRFRLITRFIKEAAHKEGKYFNPLVIGVTWPSQWWGLADSRLMRTVGHIASVGNKANDADAVGMLTVNKLVNLHLASAVPRDVPIVLMGHSYGARAISRAAYSRDLLEKTGPHRVNLIISMQPAYSVNRFIPRTTIRDGVEGAPYVVPEPIPHFITASRSDSANPFAFWSYFGGGMRAYKKAEASQLFSVTEWNKEGLKLEPAPRDLKKPVIIDASSIVKKKEPVEAPFRVRSGHNDILDPDMGRLNYHLLKLIKSK